MELLKHHGSWSCQGPDLREPSTSSTVPFTKYSSNVSSNNQQSSASPLSLHENTIQPHMSSLSMLYAPGLIGANTWHGRSNFDEQYIFHTVRSPDVVVTWPLLTMFKESTLDSTLFPLDNIDYGLESSYNTTALLQPELQNHENPSQELYPDSPIDVIGCSLPPLSSPAFNVMSLFNQDEMVR